MKTLNSLKELNPFNRLTDSQNSQSTNTYQKVNDNFILNQQTNQVDYINKVGNNMWIVENEQ